MEKRHREYREETDEVHMETKGVEKRVVSEVRCETRRKSGRAWSRKRKEVGANRADFFSVLPAVSQRHSQHRMYW